MPVKRGDPILSKLRERAVLIDVQGHLIDMRHGCIAVTCGDGDCSSDLFKHLEEVCLQHRSAPRVHLLALNGGALNLPRTSPFGAVRGQVLLDDIFAASEMKGTRTVVLLAHAPCGAARAGGISFQETIDLLVEAKLRIKDEAHRRAHGMNVACFYHVSWESHEDTEGQRRIHGRTYFVSAAQWVLAKGPETKASVISERGSTEPVDAG